VLKFTLKLPGQAKMPMTLEQSLLWTVRCVPPDRRKDKAWLIADWEAAQ